MWKTSPNALQPIALPAPGVPVPARHLVPSQAPVSMVLCRYRFDTTAQQATLLGARTIANPEAAARHFAAEHPATASPRSCPLMPTVDTGYIGILGYRTTGAATPATVQLLVPGHNECQGTTNGPTVGDTNDAAAADRAFGSGTWPV